MSYEMSIEDWTLLSDHLLEIVKDINAVIAYQDRDLKSLREAALKRVLKGMNEMILHMEENQSSARKMINDDK